MICIKVLMKINFFNWLFLLFRVGYFFYFRYSEDDLHNSRDGYSPHMSYQYQRNSLTGSSSLSNLTIDPNVTPQPVVMTKGRKIKSSLMKLEKEQDEIFEL